MKKVLCIFLAILILALAGAGIYCYQNWSIIRILFLDTEETRSNAVDTGERFHRDLGSYMNIDFDDLSDEEKEKIANGEISVADVLVERIENYTQDNPEVKEDKVNEIIIRYTEKFSALQNRYIGILEGLVAEAKAEYFSKEFTPAQKTVFLNTYMKKARAAETACDAEFEGLLSAMTAELKEVGADLSIIDTVRATYENEKAAKEVYYRNKYLG